MLFEEGREGTRDQVKPRRWFLTSAFACLGGRRAAIVYSVIGTAGCLFGDAFFKS